MSWLLPFLAWIPPAAEITQYTVTWLGLDLRAVEGWALVAGLLKLIDVTRKLL